MADGATLIERAEFERRLAVLAELHSLASLPAESLERLVPGLREERYAAGRTIVSDEASGDRRFVIVSGQAEVTAPGGVPLAVLGPGELFGEAALLAPGSDQVPVITAQTEMEVLSFDGPAFEALVEEEPLAQIAFGSITGHRIVARFIKLASPFSALTPEQARALSMKVQRQAAAAGEVVVRQGDEGDTAFLVMKGTLDVVVEQADGSEKRLSTVKPGMLFGETALLNRATRTASVRALEPCDLLVIARGDILAAMSVAGGVNAQMVELLRMRALPRRLGWIEVHERLTPEGQTIRVLKDPLRGRYHRLSPQGWFLWERLDGEHTLRHLTLDYMHEFKSFSPELIAEVIGGLAAAGFLEAVDPSVQALVRRAPWWQRALIVTRRVATWQTSIQGIDAHLTRSYRRGAWIFYTRPVQAVMALLVLAGFAAFARGAAAMREAVGQIGPSLLLFLIPLNLVAVCIHELGHAFAVKASGREVPRAEVGWHWFRPIAFADTSGMWLASRWLRIAVNLAGIQANLVLGGVAALASVFVPGLFWPAVLWQLTLVSYWRVLVNLNPLLQSDGYWVLCDWFDVPNLRPRALAWIAFDLLPGLRTAGGLRGHALDLAYGIASVLYVGLMALLVVLVYRYTLQAWVAHHAGVWLADGLAWLFAIAVIVAAGAALAAELRAPRRPAAS